MQKEVLQLQLPCLYFIDQRHTVGGVAEQRRKALTHPRLTAVLLRNQNCSETVYGREWDTQGEREEWGGTCATSARMNELTADPIVPWDGSLPRASAR